MIDIEIPQGKRSLKYRLFEMLPAFMSYGALILLVVLSLINPLWAAIYLMLFIITFLVRAVGIAIHTIGGYKKLQVAKSIDWAKRLKDLENVDAVYEKVKNKEVETKKLGESVHIDNLRLIVADHEEYPRPSDIYNAVIIAAYNESYDVIAQTVQSVIDTTYDKDRMILALAYEQRGGEAMERTAKRLEKDFGDKFFKFMLVEHPKNIPGEVIGKGGNITYAGKEVSYWLKKQKIDSKNVIVTTLDADNRPHETYFDYLTYEFIVNTDRKHLSYQPISLFTSNIWDVPAPMRVIATGNSFWNIISSMRTHTLRNFASHSQPMDALEEMGFWSTRTIVEDGHQYWRSYFHFSGNYSVVPLHVPIYQDAVMSNTYKATLKAQFIQLRRWAYGASDIPYVATRIFTKYRHSPLFPSLARFARLIDGHTTLATGPLLIAFGGWVPLLINSEAARSVAAHQLPGTISSIQQVAVIGLFISIFMSLKLLPPRPARYKKSRNVLMVLQWVLMPLTAILYQATSSLYSQGRLLLGLYLDKFDVTEKATYKSKQEAKKSK